MKTNVYNLNGFTYEVEFKPELSTVYYTTKSVYHIKSNNNSYTKAWKDIETIMNDGSWDKGIYEAKNKENPCMSNALHTYHKFSYNEEVDVYVYEFVRPYDD